MYAISNASRVYITSFFLLCAAFLLAPSLANANDYWSVLDRRFIPQESVPNAVKEMLGHKVARPSGSTLSSVPSAPTITKNATGGLSASTNQILKTLDQPSSFSSTLNGSVSSARTALKSCIRSTSCAGRALGAGAIIYEGINAWKDVYHILADDNGNPAVGEPMPVPPVGENVCYYFGANYSSCSDAFSAFEARNCGGSSPDTSRCPYSIQSQGAGLYVAVDKNGVGRQAFQQNLESCPSGSVMDYEKGCVSLTEYNYNTVPVSELDQMIDEGYSPSVSDAPIVLLSGDQTIILSEPEPAQLPSTTTTNTDSQGKITTTVKNSVITYSILNNNTTSPSIESTITETSNTYDDTANLVGSMTSTTTNNAVQPDPVAPPNAGASADIEIPPFCTWAKPLCDWLNWTQEPLEDEEPDLTQLITDFEPDEDGFDLGIGSGSCPEPIQLNLAFIDKTVEVKYDPFCDFLGMIKPFVLAAAYLFAAYLYVGVLRRG